MKTDKEIVKLIVDTARDAGLEVRSYSGRAMYGRQCVAIEFDRDPYSSTAIVIDILNTFFESRQMYKEDNLDAFSELMHELKSAKQDSLGLGGIIYWPHMEWDKEFDSDDSE